MSKLTFSTIVASLVLTSGIAMADPAEDSLVGDLTVEKRIYQHDGFGAQWAFDVGSKGLWFVNKNPEDGNYSAALKVDNNASANAFVVGSSEAGKEGFIGIGTDTPQYLVDAKWEGNNAVGDGLNLLMVLSSQNNNEDKVSDPAFSLVNGRTNNAWYFRTAEDGNAFSATKGGTGGLEFKVTSRTGHYTGTALYLGNGAKCENGVWINKSSRASKENITELSSIDAMNALNNLKPVRYNYKTDKEEQYVGFIAEDVPELVAINSRDGLSSMDMVAVVTKVVQSQNKVIKEQAIKIESLEKIQKRLIKLEELFINLPLEEATKN